MSDRVLYAEIRQVGKKVGLIFFHLPLIQREIF